MRRRYSGKEIAAIAAACIAGTSLFLAYFSVEAAKNMDVSLYDSTIVSKDEQHTRYDTKLEFSNTSFVPLAVGSTDYTITVENNELGKGKIQPFILMPYTTTLVRSEFVADNEVLNKYGGEIPHEQTLLTGSSNYDLYLTTFTVPIDHQPTQEQVQKFVK